MRILGLLALALVFGCAEEQPALIDDSPIAHAGEDEIESARVDAEQFFEKVELLEIASPAPIAGFCITGICETTRVQISQQDWPLAWKGDLDAQRNVAFCLSDGCDGAVIIDDVAACSWQTVLASADPLLTTSIDAANLDNFCSSLTPTERILSEQKTQALITAIYPD